MSRTVAFADLLRRLDRTAFERFVTDLWSRRDWETTTESGVIVATRAGGRERILVLGPDRGLARWRGVLRGLDVSPGDDADRRGDTGWENVDVVVAVDGETARRLATALDARALDAADLYGMALYGIDRDDCKALFQTHFARSVSDVVPAGRSQAGTTESRDGADSALSRGPGVVVTASLVGSALAVLVFAGLLSGVVADPFAAVDGRSGDPAGDPTTATVSTSNPASDEEGSPVDTTSEPEATDAASRSDGTLAPGLTADGVQDARTLGQAHAEWITGRSYRWNLTYEEVENGTVTASNHETVLVARPPVYRSVVDRRGELRTVDVVTRDTDVFADGQREYRLVEGRDGSRVESRPISPFDDPNAERAATYVGWFLSTNRSTVEVGNGVDSSLYEVWGRGTPYPGATNYSVVATVEPSGFVRRVYVRYDVPDEAYSVVVTFQYDDVDRTGVPTPPWYAATNTSRSGVATDASTVEVRTIPLDRQ